MMRSFYKTEQLLYCRLCFLLWTHQSKQDRQSPSFQGASALQGEIDNTTLH